MSPKNNVSEERKSQILDAAMETFSELGFHKARMSDIAETSGLAKDPYIGILTVRTPSF